MVIGVIGTVYFIENTLVVEKTTQIETRQHALLGNTVNIFEEKIIQAKSMIEITAKMKHMRSTDYADQSSNEYYGLEKTLESEKRESLQNILDSTPSFISVGFFLNDGTLYILEPFSEQEKFKFENFAFRDWFDGAMNSEGVYVSKVFDAQPDHANVIAISKKITDENNQTLGILTGIIDLDLIKNDLVKNKNSEFFLVDHNMNLIINSNKYDVLFFENWKSVKLALAGEQGIKTQKIDGTLMTIFYYPIVMGSNTWAFVSAIPYDSIFGELTLLRVSIYGVISLFVIVVLYYLSQKPSMKINSKTPSSLELSRIPNIEYESSPNVIKNKNHLPKVMFNSIAVIMIVFAGITVNDFLFDDELYHNTENLKSGYVIQNLKGDIIDTWISWNKQGDDLFHIHLQNSPEVTDSLKQLVIDVMMSQESLLIDDSNLQKGPKGSESVYYLGWSGALNSIDKETERDIPKKLHFHVTDKGEGDVIIHLKTYVNSDGYSGFTQSFVDEQNNQILKSSITIYDVDALSTEGFKTILRHELGHAFGLAHSTASEDLMYPTIATPYPYISDCTLDALTELYDGSQQSKVICEK